MDFIPLSDGIIVTEPSNADLLILQAAKAHKRDSELVFNFP